MVDDDKTTGPGPTAAELAERDAGKAVQAAEVATATAPDVTVQLAQLHELVVEHAAAMSQLHDMTNAEVEAVSKDVVQLRGDTGKVIGSLDERLAQLESRVNDALVRLGVEAAAPPPAPAAPVNTGDTMWDGMNWVPKPAAAPTPPDETS